MRKLAIITTHPIQYNAPLFKLLTERGHVRVKVFYTWGEDCLKDKYDPGFGKMIKWDIPLLEGYDFEFVKNTSSKPGSHHFRGIINPTLIKQLKEYNPDSLLVYGWSFQSHLKTLRYFKGRVNILFRGDSTLLNVRNNFKNLFRKVLLKWVYRHVDKALYVGKANENYYLECNLKESQLIFAPHSVDNFRFNFTDTLFEERNKWRQSLGIKQDDIVFLFAGKFEDNKNPEILIQTFKQVSDSKTHLVLVGNGVLENVLKEMSAGLRNIHFIGFRNQSEMPSIYSLGDVFILPSRSETWGLAVNEAMANGKAIIVSDRCGCAQDLVQNGVNGYVFKSGDHKDLAAKMKYIIDDPNLHEFGTASKKIINEFTLEKVSAAIERNV